MKISKLLAGAIMCGLYSNAAYVPMPILFPIYSGDGGNVSTNDLKYILAFYIVLNLSLVVTLIIRYFLKLKDKDFGKQSKIKNVFYDLKDYSFLEPSLNLPTHYLIVINVAAFLIVLTVLVSSIL